ncbi:hypothetical protein MLD52_17520 [Puniceicoccaceae bacterium K14]|nr:hypothetical protein [Puniceicoccaceae bacterium K14]
MNPFTWFIVLYTGSALLGILGLWFWYDKREGGSFEKARRRKVFHCVRCGSVYSARKADVSEGEACPKCEYKNYELSY